MYVFNTFGSSKGNIIVEHIGHYCDKMNKVKTEHIKARNLAIIKDRGMKRK